MKKYIISFIVAFLFITFGIVLSITELFEFDITDKFSQGNLSTKVKMYNLDITSSEINISSSYSSNMIITKDNTMQEGKYTLKVTYYDDLFDISKSNEKFNNVEYVYLDEDIVNNDFSFYKKVLKETLKGLKDKKIYNYYKAMSPSVEIILNEKDFDKFVIEED
jgi:hypothetical protein